jgi:predicted AAA+ superfamily ATPase
MVKAPKLYFLDTGLCAYLTAWSSPETLEAGAMSGSILETFIFIEILKSYWHNGKRVSMYFYRDRDAKEIDLLLIKDKSVYPLEFKKSASPHKKMIKQFELLEKLTYEVREGGIICMIDTLLPIKAGITAIPVAIL